ncbi:MAG TPA: thioredoxin domain-containing protein, partial [Longimicrobium sp.]|nr:thioredoxin domain-containing protein [Longimicrobium sp.]
MPNRLAGETSPYLLQHSENPVDWYPWGPEALGRARAEDRPILLSVGYSACHWCHVMEHESFEDPQTAALMNEHFVNVKVDREERPDIDSIYMAAVQGMTGHGGWPMTVFLTPEGAPFYGGTYFPPEPRPGMPSFPQVLTALAEAWSERRGEVDRSAAELRKSLQRGIARGVPGALSTSILDRAA